MRMVACVGCAVLLFLGSFVVVRAQGDDLREQLAGLERAASELYFVRGWSEFERPTDPGALQVISVSALTSPHPWRLHPAKRDANPEEGVSIEAAAWRDGPASLPFGRTEELGELLAEREEQAGHPRPKLISQGDRLILFDAAEQGARIEAYLEEQLRPLVLRTVLVETTWEMGAGRGDDGFRARHLSLLDTRSIFEVGRQQAVLDDAEVVVPGGPHGAVDPDIGRIFHGELVFPMIVGGGAALQAVFEFESRRVDGRMRRVATEHAGTFDAPRSSVTVVQPVLRLAPGEWEVAHRGAGVLSVRARVLARGDSR